MTGSTAPLLTTNMRSIDFAANETIDLVATYTEDETNGATIRKIDVTYNGARSTHDVHIQAPSAIGSAVLREVHRVALAKAKELVQEG